MGDEDRFEVFTLERLYLDQARGDGVEEFAVRRDNVFCFFVSAVDYLFDFSINFA